MTIIARGTTESGLLEDEDKKSWQTSEKKKNVTTEHLWAGLKHLMFLEHICSGKLFQHFEVMMLEPSLVD